MWLYLKHIYDTNEWSFDSGTLRDEAGEVGFFRIWKVQGH
jgi:hypothetical protein